MTGVHSCPILKEFRQFGISGSSRYWLHAPAASSSAIAAAAFRHAFLAVWRIGGRILALRAPEER
jgi:hypothetical protein